MTRKTGSYRQLLEYFLKEQKRSNPKEKEYVIQHNVKGTGVEQWVKAFEANEAKRLVKRSDSVKLYHEVMSISNLDSDKVSKTQLQDLANKYIELRNPNGMVIAVPHYEKNNVHYHFCFSGTEIETGKSLRISKTDFALFKKELQSYQMERYPALANSIVGHGKKQMQKSKVKNREYQLTKRTRQPSERERVKQTVEVSYSKSLSQADLMHRLSEQGLKTYHRGGKAQGVEFGCRYRFGSLGFDEKKLGELNYRDEALKGIQVFRDRDEKSKDSDKEIDETAMERDIPHENNEDYKEGRDEEDKADDRMNDDTDMENDLEY